MARSFRIGAAATTLLLLALAAGFTATAQTFEERMRTYRSGDYDTAYRTFRGLAEQGDRRAQGSLGLMYRDGLGVARDAGCAHAWFDLAVRNFPVSRTKVAREGGAKPGPRCDIAEPAGSGKGETDGGGVAAGSGILCGRPVAPPAGSGFAAALDWNLAPIVIVLVVLALVAIFFVVRSRSRNRRPEPPSSKAAASDGVARPLLPEVGSVVAGKAYVTDGDGLRVLGCTIRIAGIDAPEHDQPATHRDGYRIEHGKRVKSELIQAIGGRHVRISVERHDRYNRVVGTVTCDGKDVGEWLVHNGYAFAAYGDRYKEVEREARRAKRGMWGYSEFWHPQDWRHRTPGRG